MMQSTAIKGNREGQYDVRPAPPFNWDSQLHEFVRSLLSREIRVTRRKVGSRGHLTTCNDRTALAFGTERPMSAKLSTCTVYERERKRDAPGPDYSSASRARSLPGLWAPISSSRSSRSPFHYHPRALSSSLITVDEQPCVSSHFLSADDRPRPAGSQWFQTRFDARTRATVLNQMHWNKVQWTVRLTEF